MAQLYAINVTPLLDGSWEALMPQLSHWRQKKVMSLRHGADRHAHREEHTHEHRDELLHGSFLLSQSMSLILFDISDSVTAAPMGKTCCWSVLTANSPMDVCTLIWL